MKITSFNPVVITKDLDTVVGVFEALGFEKRHNPTGTSALGNQYAGVRMTDPNGFHMDVATTAAAQEQEKDFTAIHMNVDDFDEAYEFFTAHGFQSLQKDTVTNTGYSKTCMLASPSGFAINLIQHIK